MNRLSRILMLLVATMWLLSPLHFAAEEHRWCSEHSGFEHGDSADLLVAFPSIEYTAFWRTDARAAGVDHHSCPVIYLLERTSSLNSSQAVVSADLPPSHDSTHVGLFSVPSVPQVSLAPKTSPPVQS